MSTAEQCERFITGYNRLNEFGKRYIDAILQSLEFAQDTPAHKPSAPQTQDAPPAKAARHGV